MLLGFEPILHGEPHSSAACEMCGIAGYVMRHGSVATSIVQNQLDLLTHRGPDSRGVITGTRGVIGQTRLAIIDLETGDPPIANEDGSVGVALNGEIYNYRELRDELASTGHKLGTRGDTEVICHLAEDHGPVELAGKLHGMFAFAVWDERNKTLMLGRDRLGKKPLYYWLGSDEFVFASEIKALLEHPAVPRRLDAEAIPGYLTFGYVPTPRTFFEGIFSLPPGHVMTVDRDLRLSVEPYWEPDVPCLGEAYDIPFEAAARQVRDHLTTAVERRLISDVPLGAFLSGGIDSSTIVAVMSELSSQPVKTFTIGFDDHDGYDERAYARLVADRFDTEHVEFVVQPDAVDLVERLVWHHDQPFGDSSAIPTFLLSELTRKHVTVALSGDGGDELFAGYERFAAGLAMTRYQRLPSFARTSIGALLDLMPGGALRGRIGSLQRFSGQSKIPMPDAFRGWISYVPDHIRESLLPGAPDWAREDYRRIWRRSEGADTLDRLLDLNLRTYLLDDLLPKVDRMSMAHGLEVRSPFLDHEFVEFALRLPRRARVRGLSLKRVLKRAVADLLPPQILTREKHGFGVPLDRWFREDLHTYLRSHLCSSGSSLRSHLNPASIDQLVESHGRGSADLGSTLWTLLTLELFLSKHGW